VTGMHRDLARRAEERRPIRFAVVGAGQMGTDIASQVSCMRGSGTNINR
jgi:predicted homoserine dehydrogenase-like protein